MCFEWSCFYWIISVADLPDTSVLVGYPDKVKEKISSQKGKMQVAFPFLPIFKWQKKPLSTHPHNLFEFYPDFYFVQLKSVYIM